MRTLELTEAQSQWAAVLIFFCGVGWLITSPYEEPKLIYYQNLLIFGFVISPLTGLLIFQTIYITYGQPSLINVWTESGEILTPVLLLNLICAPTIVAPIIGTARMSNMQPLGGVICLILFTAFALWMYKGKAKRSKI